MKYIIVSLVTLFLLLTLISQQLFACEDVLVVITKNKKERKCLTIPVKRVKPLVNDDRSKLDFMIGSSIFKF